MASISLADRQSRLAVGPVRARRLADLRRAAERRLALQPAGAVWHVNGAEGLGV